MVPPTMTGNSAMPFSVSDLLQPPFDMDPSASYKRSIEMAQALAAVSSSSTSSNSSVYSSQRPSTSATPSTSNNPNFPPNYYGPPSNNPSGTFSSSNQYYDYGNSFQNGATVNGQYGPNSCWYGPAASK